jgi:hypothetical protein
MLTSENVKMGPRLTKYFKFMETNKYKLEKEIGYYLMYSFMETHCPKYPNIYSKLEHFRVMKNLYDNFDDLPKHIDKCLLDRKLLKENKVLEYNEATYPQIVKSIALSISKSNSTLGKGHEADIIIKTSDLIGENNEEMVRR